MSASRDNSQKFKFVFSNVYQIHGKKEKSGQSLSASSRVIKAGDLKSNSNPSVQVNPYVPNEVVGKKVPRPAVLPNSQIQNLALESLKQNLKDLNDLHQRLRFMLQELEELIKE
jgi:hypothetical protein